MHTRRLARRMTIALGAPLVLAAAVAGLAPAAAATTATSATAPSCQAWTGTPPPSPGTADNQLAGVTVLSPCDAWAVGFEESSDAVQHALTEHWNGSSWQVKPSSDLPGSRLLSVSAVSRNDVWAAGTVRGRALILHWDGVGWTASPTPGLGDGTTLAGISAVSGSNVWAVGSVSGGTGVQTLIMHWTGSSWHRMLSPDPAGAGGTNVLAGVAATSASSAWAVGVSSSGTGDHTLIVHWNGHKWARASSPNPAAVNELRAVAVTSADNAWAVGNSSDSGTPARTLILHWNGRTWARVASPNQGGSGSTFLFGAAATSAGDAWVVGDFASGGQTQVLLLRHHGGGWTRVPLPVAATGALFAVAAGSSADGWAVGAVTTGGPDLNIAFHCC